MDYLIGHLIGDYLLQTDRMAQLKVKSFWMAIYHGLIWTTCILVCSLIQTKFRVAIADLWPWWALLIMWLSHALQDHTRFPAKWMKRNGRFTHFRETMPQAYVWATIVVDNTMHLTLLFVLRSII